MHGQPNLKHSALSEIEAVLAGLSTTERKAYCQALYSLAHDAIAARCKDLKVMDLEILASLEEKSNAQFEEWLHSCMIGTNL